MQQRLRSAINIAAIGLCFIGSGVSAFLFDQRIALFMRHLVTGKVSDFALWLGAISDPVFLMATVVLPYVFVRYTRGSRLTVNRMSFLLASAGISSLLVVVLKGIIGRSTPELLVRDGLYQLKLFHPGSGFDSFPSEHAAVAAALAAALSVLMPTYRPTFFIVTVAIAGARIASSNHYLSDVFFGAGIGIAVVKILKVLFARYGMSLKAPGGSRPI